MAIPDQDVVDGQLNLASESMEKGSSRWPGMSYEQGVDAAIRWMMGESDEAPMEEDD